jgi:hypothetical protein
VAVRRAETATGIDAALLLAMAGRESNFDPNARSRNSSAQGLMQFTNDTWLEAVRDFGHMHGLQRQATELSSVPRGSLPANARLIDDTLRLRSDARLSTVMAAERLASWRAQLERDIGRRMSPVDLYFVHLLGPTGGRRFLLELARTPRRAAAEIVPDAARVNRKIFAPHGPPLSLAEVHRQVTQSLVLTPAVAVALQATAPVQIADAR